MVKVEGITHFLHNDKELAKLLKKKEISESEIVEFFETPEIEKEIEKLKKLNLSVDDLVEEGAQPSKPKEKKKRPLFKIEADGDTCPVYSLGGLLEEIRKRGRRGAIIQRYKGLGEMNPEQLWATTMDPSRRTLLKVILEDVVGADEMFTILMGDAVQPRKEFIEKHAHEVKRLDI